MVKGFDGLWHNAVIGGHHQDCDVRDLGTASTHSREGLVTWRIDKSNCSVYAFVLGVHLVSTDVLGDSAGFPSDYVGVSD